jgi:hypothetical protein
MFDNRSGGRPVGRSALRAGGAPIGHGPAPELLFAYGMLQSPDVQQLLLGRTVDGVPDHLPGFVRTVTTIEDAGLVAASRSARHPVAVLSVEGDTSVPGTVYRLTPADLATLDARSAPEVHRVRLSLASGLTAWTYVDRHYRPAPPRSPHPRTFPAAA